jgi:hypothetical protein
MTRSFRPSGIGRYFIAAFLLLWLVGWAVGEGVALFAVAAILLKLIGGAPPGMPAWFDNPVGSGVVAFVILFLGLWLTFWTVGGIAAWTHFIRSLWGEDTIALTPEGVEIVRRGGPFRRRYRYDRAAIRRIRLRPSDKGLVMDAEKGTQPLTTFGTPEERQEAADWLIRSLSLPDEAALAALATPPAGWETFEDADGTRLRKVRPRGRAIRSAIMWTITALLASAWLRFRAGDAAADFPALALTLLFAVLAMLSTFGRRDWIVRRGEVVFRRRFLIWKSERAFRHARLHVTSETDSDNDSVYTLVIADADGRTTTMHSQLHDAAEVVDFGHWLAARSGFPFTLPSDIRQRVGPAAAR